ncbi:MAG: COG3014 family protein [Myxococcaceae bacterium]
MLSTPRHPLLASCACALFLWGCAGDYVARTRSIRQAYEAEKYDAALAELGRQEKEPGKDRLLYLMDRGMVLHAAQRYEESIKVLAEADRLAKELDVVSVSEEAHVLLSNERERHYRGEDFEKLMISVLQALNYARLDKDEDALVEVRRVNERLTKMVRDEKKPYEQLAIARYLGGVLYEDQGNADSAFIDYWAAYKLQPKLGALADPLVRLARETAREDAYRELRKSFPDVSDASLAPNEGQLLVLVEAGRSPEKGRTTREAQPGNIIDIPVYVDRGAPPIVAVTVGQLTRRTVAVTNLRDVARIHLNERVGRMIGQQIAQAAVKAGVAAGVGAATKSAGLGALAFLALTMLNAPDLRSWLSLPATFELARFRLPAGPHTVRVDAAGRVTEHPVEVRPGRVSLLLLRRY